MSTMDGDAPEPTLKDIARAAGLSVAAVSKVINNREGVSQASRERVTRIMIELGYRGRAGKSTPEPLTRARILTLGRYVTNDGFYGDVFAGIIEAGQAQGIAIDIVIAGETEASSPVSNLSAESFETPALLVGIDSPALIERVVASGSPSVIVNGMDRSMRLPSVSADYHFGGWMATRHLLDLGHRNILHITHPYRETIRRRVDGFRNAIEEAGIHFEPDRHILDLGSPRLLSIEARGKVSEWLAAADRLPTAIVCVNDIVALAAMQEIQARGFTVPDDISVIGFDDLPAGAHASPPLTTMRVDRRELGRLGIRLLVAQAADDTRQIQRIVLAARLIDRQSTAAARPW